MADLLSVAGPRRPAYVLAVWTGLRRGELNALEWDDVHLDLAQPAVHVRASISKNGKAAVLALHPEAVRELVALRPQSPTPADRVLSEGCPTMEAFRLDLKAAEIVENDSRGQRVDFHALRKTLATRLAVNGTSPRVSMEIMRHSDLRLTMNTYTDGALLPVSSAVQSLPSLMTQKSGAAECSPKRSVVSGPEGLPVARGGAARVPGKEPLSRVTRTRAVDSEGRCSSRISRCSQKP
ncbi:MAG: tyrosine-type recombinase/integrase [Verrucomicrobiia bacterium]